MQALISSKLKALVAKLSSTTLDKVYIDLLLPHAQQLYNYYDSSFGWHLEQHLIEFAREVVNIQNHSHEHSFPDPDEIKRYFPSLSECWEKNRKILHEIELRFKPAEDPEFINVKEALKNSLTKDMDLLRKARHGGC